MYGFRTITDASQTSNTWSEYTCLDFNNRHWYLTLRYSKRLPHS